MSTIPSGLPDAKTVGAVIVAAGDSTRMEGVDKTFAPLGGEPLIAHTVDAFECCPAVGTIVLVVAEASQEDASRLVKQRKWQKVHAVTQGGPRRQDSVASGVAALPPCEWVVVHDGARPLVTPVLITEGLKEVAITGAIIAAVPSKDTVKVVGAGGTVEFTPDRREIWMVQTPQVFNRALLEWVHGQVKTESTDDAAMVERMGVPVRVFMGSYTNIKVTTPEDLLVAEVLLAGQKGGGR